MRTENDIDIYKYDELSNSAKYVARDKYRENLDLSYAYEYVYEDAERIAEILGIEFKYRPNSKTPSIYWSGFWSQGSGLAFECTYRYKKGSCKEIRSYAGQDSVLWSIADRLYKAQKPYFYKLEAQTNTFGHRDNSMWTQVWLSDGCCGDLPDDVEEEIKDILEDFARWIYDCLEAEYDYHNSDKAIDEWLSESDNKYNEDGNEI